jgi:UDP-glucose 4-epimerase
LRTLADLVVRLAGPPAHYTVKQFPAERAQIDIGSYHADDSAFRAATGWQPQVSLEDGIRQTIEWYKPRLADYL